RRADGAQREAERILLTRYTPPGVLVSDDLEILQFHGDTSAYLAPLAGKASLNLIKMLREGLLAPIRSALARARTEGPVRKNDVRLKGHGLSRVDIEVLPVKGMDGDKGTFLILFHQPAHPAPGAAAWSPSTADQATEAEARE